MSTYQEKTNQIEKSGIKLEDYLENTQEPFGFITDRALWGFGQEHQSSIQQKLRTYGYKIPVLQIERNSLKSFQTPDKEFKLPIDTHDIYEDAEYSELCEILRRMDPNSNQNDEVIRFRIDYRTIWQGITGTAL
ncbi:MAG: hypothetical protein K9W44_04345 [Candidatus Lokiarchaeota archaeon]|nr:hypothetical protein [Candidatus Harpocratesius repetitus]